MRQQAHRPWWGLVLILSVLASCTTVLGFAPALNRFQRGVTGLALYQSKRITCYTEHETFNVLLSSQMEFAKLCEEYGVSFVVDGQGRRIFSYASLDDAETYSVFSDKPLTLMHKQASAIPSGKYEAETGRHDVVAPSSDEPFNMGTTRRGPRRWQRIMASLQAARRNYWKRRFDYKTLPPPDQVRPLIPIRDQPEKYVCPDGFRESLLATVNQLMEQEDGGRRVPPMALVGCSRSGKTRTLEEIAASLAQNATNPVVVLSVTFSDYSTSSLIGEDQQDPLQALCQRIVFAATRSTDNGDFDSLQTAYESFREQNYRIDPKRIVHWLAGSRAILLIDELNFLKGFTSKSPQAHKFGNFIRSNFLSNSGRCFIFSSHVLGTVLSFGAVVDSSDASSRRMVVQSLPRVDNLLDIHKYLDPSMETLFKAIYFGLLPGLIYEQQGAYYVNAKAQDAVVEYNMLPMAEKEVWTMDILRSLFSGNNEHVPLQLQILVAARPIDGSEQDMPGSAKISWVPFILEYVLRQTTLVKGSWLAKATESLAALCSKLPHIPNGSGRGYETLFGIVALARCIAHCPDGVLLPEKWFNETALEVKLNPFDAEAAGKLLGDCRNWAELQKGADIQSLQPTAAIFLPGHAHFRSYDVIAAYYKGGKLVEYRAFQLKEGNHGAKRPHPSDEFPIRFLVKGKALVVGRMNKNGWIVPSAADIDEFFGESGRYWTPLQWARLQAAFGEANDETDS